MQTSVYEVSPAAKLWAFVELLKARLSALVAFSCAFGYLLATEGQVQWLPFFMLIAGGFLLSGASVTVNQIMEVQYDKMMERTMNRPLPTGRVSSKEAMVFAGICLLSSLAILWLFTNPLTVCLSFLSVLLYTMVYTPMKRVGAIAVFVGAIPGALPPLLGWTACTGKASYEAFIIFAMQFIWQFPHFWAIAWLADRDYKKAGFKLLPSSGPNFSTASQMMFYTLFLIPAGLLPMAAGITGIVSAWTATLAGCIFFAQTISLMKNQDDKAARRIMFGSFLYLPVVQLSFLLDKI